MEQTKKWTESLAVKGGLVAVSGSLASLFGVPVLPDDLAALGGHIAAIITAIGGIIAIYGRIRATARIG